MKTTRENLILGIGLILATAFTGCSKAARGTVTSTYGKLYVINAATPAILRFDGATTITGDAAPGATISGTLTQLGCPQFAALDAFNDRMFLGDFCNNSVEIFDSVSTLSGNVAPVRILSGSNTTLSGPQGVALDYAKDLLYVSNSNANSILVFQGASGVTGNAAPIRTISGAATGLNFNHGLLLDAANDRLYVANLNGNSVTVYDNASTLNGNIAPIRTITGAATQLTQPVSMQLFNDVLMIATRSGLSINVFSGAATINGNVTPDRVISGASTALNNAYQTAYLPDTDELYVGNAFGGNVLVFSPMATTTNNATPARIITGSHTGLNIPAGANPARSSAGLLIDPSR